MDTAEGSSLQSALELQGAMLGRHEQELSSTRHSVDNLSAQFAGLVERLDRLTLSGFASAPLTVGPSPLSSEPRVNNPPTYAGEPKSCKSFLIQCEVVFSLQSRTYASETSKVAYVISLLTGRAREWGTAVWESQARCCFEFESFKDEMIKTFDQSVFGKEASRLLASIQQGRRSVADYSVEFRTLAATSGWNAEALVARFLEGLNDAFKDELYAREVPDRLDDLISLALRLDARRELRRRARMRTEPVASIPLAPSSDETTTMYLDTFLERCLRNGSTISLLYKGLEQGHVDHPVVISEPPCNPLHCRQMMSELLFECYGVPRVAYGVDSLFSFYYNSVSDGADLPSTGLVVSSGYHCSHVLPFINGRLDALNCKRVNLGGGQATAYLQRLLQLKYPANQTAITLSRMEELLHQHSYVALDYQHELDKWRSPNFYEREVHRVQLPFSGRAAGVCVSVEERNERKAQQLRRLQEINSRRREEKLQEDQKRLETLLSVQELLEDGSLELFHRSLVELNMDSAEELQSYIHKLSMSVEQHRLMKAEVSLAQRPALDAWYGACEWALTNSAEAQGWISRHDYEENGGEYLKEHCASNIFIPMKLNKPSSATKQTLMGKCLTDTSLPDATSNDKDNDISLS
ncbi:actin-related 5 [Labeo rohita]|uniref:Actin-related 5 n=1 Tax=Labeo rohita TaxID=84645 RepID=A0A498MA89_LABRO|nr:actin-related 5 [Labeo rohita]